MPTEVPSNYALYNQQSTKRLAVVVQIEGLSDYLSSTPLYTRVRFGDPGINYGDPGLVWGGLRRLSGVRDYLSLDASSMTISQRLEPEQGRAALSTLSLSFVDKDQYMTQLISPGVILNEILGKEVVVYLGYQEISFPEDYFVIFRGRISGVQTASGMVTLSLSDPNLGRKQSVFYSAKTQLNGALTNVATTVNVVSNGDFHKSILGPAGTYDSSVKLYMKVEDEYIEYGPSFTLPAATFGTNTFTGVSRGARGTTAVAHDSGTDVESVIGLEGHAIDLALKLMLSGWSGVWKTGVSLYSIVKTTDPGLGDIPDAIILPAKKDAVRDYGIATGDYLTISGSGIGGNNVTVIVTSLADLFGDSNRIIRTNTTLSVEYPTSAVFSIRSKFDTLPVTCGVKLKETEVAIQTHLDLKNQFLGSNDYTFSFLLSAPESCKAFIEAELLLPMSAYSLTKNGQLSIGLTHPPIADSTLVYLTADNILDPQNIKPKRDLNQSRKFFNQITYQYDQSDSGTFGTTQKYLDTDSLNNIGLVSVLPITSRGAKTSLGFTNVVERQSSFLLSRYKNAATVIECKVNWEVGSLLESGDVIALKDNGTLQISNFTTGERDLGVGLWEVVDRSLDIKSGNVSLKLISGLGAEITDRYATIAPSSVVTTGSTLTTVNFSDSYPASDPIFPGNEKAKWENYIGLKVLIHSFDYTTYSQEATILGFNPANPYQMLVSGLTLAPSAGYIIDPIDFPTSTDPLEQQGYKIVHAFFSPYINVVSGISSTQFTVSAGDIGKFNIGQYARVHTVSFSFDSLDVLVTAVDTGTNTVTVEDMGFIPAAGYKVDLIGFADGSAAYRWI